MPTYEYRCKSCGKQTDIFHSMTEAPRRKCPACGKNALERMIGTGGAVIFKGSGFYQTDYRSESYKKAAAADKNGSSSGSETKSAGSGSDRSSSEKSSKDSGAKKASGAAAGA